MYFVATVVAVVYSMHVFRRRGWNPDEVLPGLLLTVLAAYIGARLHGALLPWDRFVADPMGQIMKTGGLSFFGGLALGSLALVSYIRWRSLPLGETTNALVPLAPLLYAIFRVGCFLNGDDYGQPTTRPWGMSFPQGAPPTDERVHPTQIYEIILMAPIFAWLWSRRDADLPGGTLAFEACVLMGAERFVVEFWRLGERGPAGLTVSQWLAVALISIGVAGWYWTTRRGKQIRD
jgi:phosphatidylglycerol:prolipoprotein diacylglycerol transferase